MVCVSEGPFKSLQLLKCSLNFEKVVLEKSVIIRSHVIAIVSYA